MAIEINQSSRIARLQFADEWRSTWQEGELAVFGEEVADIWEKSIIDPESLSLAESRRLDAYLAFQLTIARRVLDLEQDGFLESGAAEAHMENYLPFFFDTVYAKTWWDIEGRTWGDELVTIADPIVRETPLNLSVDRLQKIKQEAASKIADEQQKSP